MPVTVHWIVILEGQEDKEDGEGLLQADVRDGPRPDLCA